MPVVQHASSQAVFSSGSSGSVTVTLGSAATAGNALVACIGVTSASAAPTVSAVKTGASAENWAKGTGESDATFGIDSEIWTDLNTAGGGTTVVVTAAFGQTATSTKQTIVQVDVFEVSGVLASPAVDKTHASGGGNDSASWSSGATAATAQADEIAFGHSLVLPDGGGTGTVTPPGSPWTSEATLHDSGSVGGFGTFNMYSTAAVRELSSTGAVTYAGTASAASFWVASVLTLKAGASGDVTVTPQAADHVSGTVSGSTMTAHSVTSFSPAAGDLVRVEFAWLDSVDQLGKAFAVTDNHGNTYGVVQLGGDADGGCYLGSYQFRYATAPGATTVTVTCSGTGATDDADCEIQPYRIARAATDQSTAARNKFSESGTSVTAYQISLTTTQAGSAVFCSAAPNHNGGATGLATPIAGTVEDDEWDDAGVGSHGVIGRGASLTGTPGATTFGWTTANPSPFGYGVMASEVIPAPAGGTSHNASASLTVTPSFSAVPSARQRSASLAVTPSLSAAATGGAPTFTASASLTVTPSLGAAVQVTRRASASLTVTPSFSAAPAGAHFAAASLTVTPAFSAVPHAVHRPSAPLTVTPVLSASAEAAEGAPPGYPDGELGARVELLLGGTWTDVTDAALPDGRQYASIKSGQPDGAQQPVPASMPLALDNPDGGLSPRNSASPYFGELRQNTPARVSVNSTYGSYLRLEGDSAGFASVPDSPGVSITGDTDIQLELALSDYSRSLLASKWGGGGNSTWALYSNDDGTLTLEYLDSSGTDHANTSTLPVPVRPGITALRATLDVSDSGSHTATFYTGTSLEAADWAQLGDPVSGAGAVTLHDSTAPVTVGFSTGYQVTDANPGYKGLTGSVTGFRLLSGIGGTLRADARFSEQPQGAASWADAQGNSWSLGGGAEVSARDYLLHGELSSLAPSADVSGGMARTALQVSGRLRRLSQGGRPPADSPMKRAIMSQAGDLAPVAYWPAEDKGPGLYLGPAAGASFMTVTGPLQRASSTAFEASAPLPVLNGARLQGNVTAYTGATAWAVRFLCSLGLNLPATGSVPLLRANVSGAVHIVQVDVYQSPGALGISGTFPDGSQAFDSGPLAFDASGDPRWYSLEATPVSGGVKYAVVTVQPGAGTGSAESQVVTTTGSFGNVLSFLVNPGGFLTDTAAGHFSVQKAWTSLFGLGAPLNAWRTEKAGDRFLRICAEQGITSRITGAPARSAAMGPQPAGNVYAVIQDIAATDQGLLYEPPGALAAGYRTRESMLNQADAVTLSFAGPTLPGNLSPADDDQGLVNDWTVSDAGGTQFRATLDDGSARSASEPRDGGAGRYQDTARANVASPSMLQDSAGWHLNLSAADEARYRQVTADFGIPGAPADDISRLRPGDLARVTGVPGIYQSGDIRQLVTGFTHVLGPGRKVTWDCQPASPFTVAAWDDPGFRWGTRGSALHAAVTAAATSVTASGGAVPWTTDSGSWPFDVEVDGDVMTVTHVAGSSGTQTLTVTRSAGAAAHAPGAAVRLAQPSRWA